MNAVIYEQKEKARIANMHNRTPPKSIKANELIHPFAVIEDNVVTWHIKWIQTCNEKEIKL